MGDAPSAVKQPWHFACSILPRQLHFLNLQTQVLQPVQDSVQRCLVLDSSDHPKVPTNDCFQDEFREGSLHQRAGSTHRQDGIGL